MSATSRDQILARIRAANGAAAHPRAGPNGPNGPSGSAAGQPADRDADADAAYAALSRRYVRAHHDPAGHDIAALFAERAADYRAVVERVPDPGLAAAIAGILATRAAAVPDSFVVPDGLPAEWLAELPSGITLTRDEPPLAAAELDRMSGVVTGCAVAVAETGTIILAHGPGAPGQGRRALTLVPDFHLVVVREAQIAADLADALARLDPARPHTLISGPSATSDIELIRVEGVHGPRNLHILLTA
ncbi:MAG TPA: LUD domain-containing protein [Streptosporangiaceae bacterium]